MLPENPNRQGAFQEENLETIYLAGGCFWGAEAFLERVPGVCSTQVGYANGKTENPTYEAVCHENTGHAETVEVCYDKTKLPFEKLLAAFFQIINPTSLNRQGGDVGSQYRTGIYYREEAQKEQAEAFIKSQQPNYEKAIVTEVLPLEHFYPAEEYHQKYLEKNPGGYCHVNLNKLADL